MKTYAINDKRYVEDLLYGNGNDGYYDYDAYRKHERDHDAAHKPKPMKPDPMPPMNDDPDTSIVVFDMIQGVSSSHSDRTFDADTAYTIYIRVDSDSSMLNTDANAGPGTYGIWSLTSNLGADDRIVLVGNDADNDVVGGAMNGPVTGFFVGNDDIGWSTAATGASTAAQITVSGRLFRTLAMDGQDLAAIFTTVAWQSNPDANQTFTQVYQRTMADAILVTQGLL